MRTTHTFARAVSAIIVAGSLAAGVAAQNAPGEETNRQLEEEIKVAIKRSQEKTPIPRRPDGKPDLTGQWNPNGLEVLNILEAHPGGFGVLASPSLIVDPPDGKIPYQPWALVERDRRRRAENHWEDNRLKCGLTGPPRTMLFAFNALFTKDHFVRHAGANEHTLIARLNGKHELHPRVHQYRGDSIAYWEGDTLVVDTRNNAAHWLGIGGDFYSENATVIERFTMINRDTMNWEATITDPTVFTRPWTQRYPAPWTRAGRGGVVGGARAGRGPEDNEDSCHEGNLDVVHFYNLRDQVRQKNQRR